MEYYQILAVAIYAVGLLLWFVLWRAIVGYGWLKQEPLMYLPFLGGAVVLAANIVLSYFAAIPEYGIEIGIYGFVENNAKTIAAFTLGIAVFVVVTFEKTVKLETEESRKFLELVFASFLLAVVGVLPLIWVPQNYGWLTTLRHLKTVPYTYSLFIFAAGMVIYIHEIRASRARESSAKSVE